eukprot:TRINITY_DN4328_c1_g2_i6.p1 TRINITY_DN4328_c1_g2~~TRINITY_DN4328_c1_g2_i6.p1  ORF type:complete len:271 (-),score=31.52 TRINITY_DN4328_c1_g2_i6:872-1684(-)
MSEVLSNDESQPCGQATSSNSVVDIQTQSLQPKQESEPFKLHTACGSFRDQNMDIGMDSADIYNFFLGEGEKVLKRVPSCLCKPQQMESVASLFVGGELFKTRASFNSPYVRIRQPQQAGPSSQVCSGKRSPSIGLSSITQSSLLSNLSTTRSQQLRARRDARRKRVQTRTPPPPPVSSLLRQVQTQSSLQRQCFSREDTNTADSFNTSSSVLPDEGGEEVVEQLARKGSSFRLPSLANADKLDSIGLMWEYDVHKNRDTNPVTIATNRQ